MRLFLLSLFLLSSIYSYSQELIWSDEFDIDGAVNPDNWHHQTQIPAGGSWYNGEVQHYTDRLDNSYVSDGVLYIVAKKESFTDQGYTKQYTSARLNSKFAFKYGRVEVRAKLPTGVGTWPAIWMLGKNINEDGGYWDNQGFGTTGWPACGEIDIMEHWGSNQNYVQSAMHTPSSYGGTINHGGQTISTVSSEFHVYELEWTSEKMVFSVDGVEHYTYNPAVKDASTWPYDADQYFLLNIAIEPGIDQSFTQSAMEIDYIRVYEIIEGETTDPTSATNIYDDFEGNGTITTWAEDASLMDVSFTNPYQTGINTSSTVLKYEDNGGTYANIRFDTNDNFDLSLNSSFALKVYIPSDGITGSQPNQISLKLQNGNLGEPWSTQCEIIKPLLLDQWQEVQFDFATDNYINLDINSPAPLNRSDFNRVVLQVNGENNSDAVIAYIDDFIYDRPTSYEEISFGEHIIAPNPTSGLITISGVVDEVVVYDLMGKKVLHGYENTLDMQLLPKGIYLLKIMANGVFSTTKVFKK
ncbi:glycosyl hydrolase family protein [Labilibacter sediminis]|nr:glycosyl hydrolase family protein [Labilibacter sediminis]